MKTRFLTLLAILASLSFTGCVFMNDEDKDFYGKGWIHPTELDQVTPRHPAVDPAAPDYQATAATSRAPTKQSPEWIVPETTDNNQ